MADFLTGLSIWVNIAVFALAAVVVWFAGAKLSRHADAIADRTGMGKAFAGVFLLGVATSLPELATTATASLRGNSAMAGNNLLGGVAIQIAVLAAVDALAFRGAALTFFSPSPVLLLQGIFLIVMLAIAAAAIAIQDIHVISGIGLWSIILGVAYVLMLYVSNAYEGSNRWVPHGEMAEVPQEARQQREQQTSRFEDVSLRRLTIYFLLASLAILASGYVVAVTGEAIAEQSGLGSSFVGATLVALATSLPEISTTTQAIRMGAYSMAVANILGTNMLEVALFLPADAFYRDGPIFNTMEPQSIFLAMLGTVITCIYLWGILERRNRTLAGMGHDSAAILAAYAAGVTVYYFIS